MCAPMSCKQICGSICCCQRAKCCRKSMSWWLLIACVIAIGGWGSWRLVFMIVIPFLLWTILVCNVTDSPNGLYIARLLTLFVTLIFILYLFVYASFASQAADTYWPLHLGGDPICNQSSCSPVTLQNEYPYRPASYGPLYALDVNNDRKSIYFHYCPNLNCRWAGDNGNHTIQGYQEGGQIPCSGVSCANLASTNVKDYPNKGIGLAQGYFFNSVVTETALCEGVDPIVPEGQLPKGRLICSVCTAAFVERGLLPTADGCDDPGGNWFCFVCPGFFAGEKSDFATLEEITYFFMGTAIWFALLVLYLCCCTPKRGRGADGYTKIIPENQLNKASSYRFFPTYF